MEKSEVPANKKEKTEKGDFNKNKEIFGKIEAVMFATGEPIKISKLAQFLKINRICCKEKLEELAEYYKKNQRGLEIIFKKDQAQMVSNFNFGEEVAKFLNKELNEDLSRAAAEVLAVVAYRGPISRAEIEYIRGVNCSFTLRNLAIRGLIERKDNPQDSRSYLYELSFDLLKNLGVSKVEELPDFEKLKRQETAEAGRKLRDNKP